MSQWTEKETYDGLRSSIRTAEFEGYCLLNIRGYLEEKGVEANFNRRKALEVLDAADKFGGPTPKDTVIVTLMDVPTPLYTGVIIPGLEYIAETLWLTTHKFYECKRWGPTIDPKGEITSVMSMVADLKKIEELSEAAYTELTSFGEPYSILQKGQ